MKKALNYFVKGLLIVMPLALTIWVVIKIMTIIDSIFASTLKAYQIYFPGVGVILTLVIITAIGVLASNWVTGSVFRLIDNLFHRLPLVKIIYTTFKDTLGSFTRGKKGFSKLVIVELGNGLKVPGFITNEELEKLHSSLAGHMAVYLMQSMQWAGNLIFVPADRLTLIDLPLEEAIKFIASAGLIAKGR